MKGLLIKDFKLITGQKRFLLVVPIFGLFFMITNEDAASGIGYIMMLTMFLVLGTISYDEYDNGMSFLMTLPIDRTMYVAEKYVFSGLLLFFSAITAFVFAMFVAIGMNITVVWKELLLTNGILLVAYWLMMAAAIPAQIKYGAEKGRIAIVLIGGGVFIIFVLLAKGKEYFGIDLSSLLTKLENLHESVFIIVGAVVVIGLTAGSYAISKNIIKKKEF